MTSDQGAYLATASVQFWLLHFEKEACRGQPGGWEGGGMVWFPKAQGGPSGNN